MKYNDIAINMLIERLRERSMKDSTPKKYSCPMLEAAEVIEQLLKERVVFCRDCKFRGGLDQDGIGDCKNPNGIACQPQENDFCS